MRDNKYDAIYGKIRKIFAFLLLNYIITYGLYKFHTLSLGRRVHSVSPTQNHLAFKVFNNIKLTLNFYADAQYPRNLEKSHIRDIEFFKVILSS